MNDYLWDKKGSNPAIEELEDQLSEFRLSRRAPVLNIPAAADEKRPFRRWLQFAFAVPAFAALIIAGISYYRITPDLGSQSVVRGRQEIPDTANNPPIEVQAKPIKTIPIDTGTRPVRTVPRKRAANKVYKQKYSRPTPARKTPRVTIAETDPVLTLEEQEAYAELIRALTITSSKLKLVKDKVNGPLDVKGTK